MDKINLPDVQNTSSDFVRLGIKKIGVRRLKLRLPIQQKDGETQEVFADISSYISLPLHKKGANLSRFARTMISELDMRSSGDGIEDLSHFAEKLRLANDDAEDVYLKASFPYMVEYQTPISKLKSPEPINCTFESILQNGTVRNYLTVVTNESSACCCSYEMSKLSNNLKEKEKAELETLSPELREKLDIVTFGVHNQRSQITIKVELIGGDKNQMWMEDLLNYAKLGASSPTFNVLKREDEKYVTEVMVFGKYIDENFDIQDTPYKGVAFSEDIGRNVATLLGNEMSERIADWSVVVDNEESIHSTLLATSVLTAGVRLT